MMKYNDAYSMMGAMINQAFADQHEKKAQAYETKSGHQGSWRTLFMKRSPKSSDNCNVIQTAGCTCTTECKSCV